MATPAEQAAIDRVLAGLRELNLMLERVDVGRGELVIALSHHFEALVQAESRETSKGTDPDPAERYVGIDALDTD